MMGQMGDMGGLGGLANMMGGMGGGLPKGGRRKKWDTNTNWNKKRKLYYVLLIFRWYNI